MKNNFDVVVIGAGIMGLFTAYFLAERGAKVVVLDRSTVGNREAASTGLTRSFRQDYIDPDFAKMAFASRKLWEELEEVWGTKVFYRCGCLNLYKQSLTADIENTYARKVIQTMNSLGFEYEDLKGDNFKKSFKCFSVDGGVLDLNGGILDVSVITTALLKFLKMKGAEINENIAINTIDESSAGVHVDFSDKSIYASSAIITVGKWTNEILPKIKGSILKSVPIKAERPIQCRYLIPPAGRRDEFSVDNFPVFAYLDLGMYGHPILNERSPGLKIGFFNPEGGVVNVASNISHFVEECMPELALFESIDVLDVDQGFYQMVEDRNFILGALPESRRIFLGCGWLGTGFKFAPLVGQTLCALVLKNTGDSLMNRFCPSRFL